MKIALAARFDAHEEAAWHEALAAACPSVQWVLAPQAGQAFDAAVVANPAPGALQGLRGLRLIQSLWAGVDRLLADPTLPADVPLARMVDPAMNAAMAQTAVWAVLSLHRGFFAYGAQQRMQQWLVHPQRRADEVKVLVLGQGQMGRSAARAIAALAYPVCHWQRGTALAPLLRAAQIVVNLLPLTPHTEGLIDAAFLAALPRGASVVNLARGGHVVDADLLAALDSGHIQHAVLDVFHAEPLPAGHRYWTHPHVTVLPHAAAQTDPRSACEVVAENLRRLQAGEPVLHLVERRRGY